MIRLRNDTKRAVFEAGWQVLSCYQPPWSFVQNGRKLKQSAEPGDPWLAVLFNGASILTATRQISATGATADAAVLAALTDTGPSFREAMGRLEAAWDGLIGAMT